MNTREEHPVNLLLLVHYFSNISCHDICKVMKNRQLQSALCFNYVNSTASTKEAASILIVIVQQVIVPQRERDHGALEK